MIDPDRFQALLTPHRDLLRGYVHRLVGHPADADDLVQDTLVKAMQRLGTLRSEAAFRSWLLRIATHTCVDHLRKQKRWRPLSQVYAEEECASTPGHREEVQASMSDPQFVFDAREHIAFCFTCVGRSLEPMQQAAVILREVLGYGNREAAEILGVSESVLRHRLSEGRQHMQTTFDGLCALVGKQGACWQCAGFRQAAAPGHRGPPIPTLAEADDQGWADRVEVAREHPFLDGQSTPLHTLLFERIRSLESRRE